MVLTRPTQPCRLTQTARIATHRNRVSANDSPRSVHLLRDGYSLIWTRESTRTSWWKRDDAGDVRGTSIRIWWRSFCSYSLLSESATAKYCVEVADINFGTFWVQWAVRCTDKRPVPSMNKLYDIILNKPEELLRSIHAACVEVSPHAIHDSSVDSPAKAANSPTTNRRAKDANHKGISIKRYCGIS